MIKEILTQPHRAKLVSNFFSKELFSSLSLKNPLVIITDHHIQQLHLPPIISHLKLLGYKVLVLAFTPGEQSKTFEVFLSLQQQLIDLGISSGTPILGWGGGVVLDIAGFVAATCCRGVPLYLVPTTLTAMIDASIGGKNGINLQGVKNRLGTVYLPKDVWICPEFLSTLPQHEWSYGIAEAIKHGVIADPYIWEFLHTHHQEVFSSPKPLKELILRNCQVKAAIVKEDLHDRCRRKILNFGHSIAHAIEALSEGHVPHGKAVSVGMMIETQLSLACGVLWSPQVLKDLRTLLKLFHLPTTLEELRTSIPQSLHEHVYHPGNLMRILHYDKKNPSPKEFNMVMIERLGKAASFQGTYCASPRREVLLKVLENECSLMRYN